MSAIVVEHLRFGRLEVAAGDVIRLEDLPGFPEARRFILLRHDRSSPFLWLVSLDVLDLAFVVTDPHLFFPDYAPALPEVALRAVQATSVNDVDLYAVANVRDGVATLNLAAPLLVHATAGIATQSILEAEEYSNREPLPSPPRPGAGAGAQIESKPQT